MTQHQSNDTKTEKHTLTFFIETQLVDEHPCVVRLRELHHGTRRFLKRSQLLLYHLGREQGTAGEALARLIYEDQVANRQGMYKAPPAGPRIAQRDRCRAKAELRSERGSKADA
jgi:hypothetical protein